MMTKPESPEYRACENYREHYAEPSAVVSDGALSLPEKQSILSAWERDLRQLMVAAGEGLEGGDAETGEELKRVHEALAALGLSQDPEYNSSDTSGSPM